METQQLPRTKRRKFVDTYDFKHPKLFSKEIMRTLRGLHETLGRSLNRTFSSALRSKVDVQLVHINQMVMSEFVHQIGSPGAVYLISIEELGGEVIMDIQPGFCLYLVERQSGGRGSGLLERRTLTTIEEKIMSRIMKRVKDEIVAAWAPFMEFSIRSVSYESKPENIHMVSDDPAVVAEFRVEVGRELVDLKVAYPYSLLKESLNQIAIRMDKHTSKEEIPQDVYEGYEQTLKNVNVSLQPLLGTTRLSLWDLLNLEVGDAIPLNQKVNKPLKIRVNGTEKMTAYPGTSKNRRAVKIYEVLEEIKERELK